MLRQKGRIICLRVVDRLQRYIGIKQLWKPLKTVLDLCLGEIGELLICFQVLLWEDALARTHLSHRLLYLCSFELLSSYLCPGESKKTTTIDWTGGNVSAEIPLMNNVQPNEVETGQFRQFYPRLDICEFMLEAPLGFKSWMTRIVIIWIIPETDCLSRVNTHAFMV